MTGEPPFASKKNDSSVIFIVLANKRPQLPPVMVTHEKLGALVEECWVQAPKSRPDMRNVCLRLESDILGPKVLIFSFLHGDTYHNCLGRGYGGPFHERGMVFIFHVSVSAVTTFLGILTHEKIPPNAIFLWHVKQVSCPCAKMLYINMSLLRGRELPDLFTGPHLVLLVFEFLVFVLLLLF